MARERLAQVAEVAEVTGAAPRVLVTGCAACQRELAAAAAADLRVVDPLTVLDEALG